MNDDTFGLGVWIGKVRIQYRDGLLSAADVAYYESLPGWMWHSFDDGWTAQYEALRLFIEKNGRLPQKSEAAAGGRWGVRQREAYNTGKLSPERAARLEALPGWTWDVLTEVWSSKYEELKAFVAANDRLPMRSQWVSAQRARYRAGKLSGDRIALLEALPRWAWNTLEDAWSVQYEELKRFIAENGRLPGQKKSAWYSAQRDRYRKGKLSAERIGLMEALPLWTWKSLESQWSAQYAELKMFIETNGRLPILKEMVWVSQLLTNYKTGTLSGERIALLEALPGWTWTPSDDKWLVEYENFKAFIKENDRLPTAKESAWTSHQRQAYKAGRLSTEKVALLEALPLWVWSVLKDSWTAQYEALQTFVKDNGRLPKTADMPWVLSQRTAYRAGNLSEERIALLEALPLWSWHEGDTVWLSHYEGLKRFIMENDKMPKASESVWLTKQRVAYNAGKLSAERIALLESLPGWVWDGTTWNDRYAELKAFVMKNGRIPTQAEMGWASKQRGIHKAKKLSAEKVTLLEALPFWTWVGRNGPEGWVRKSSSS